MNEKVKRINIIQSFMMIAVLSMGIFAFDQLAVNSDAVNTDSFAGLYAAPEPMPISLGGGYEVYFGTESQTLIGRYNTLSDACAAVNADDSGSDYSILVTADDPAMGLTAAIDSGRTVTLSSGGESAYSITQVNSSRHLVVKGGLIMNNILLNGNRSGGGLLVSSGMLEMNAGAVVTKCASTVSGSGIYLDNSAFKMNGGEISDNHQSTTFGASGGGVFMSHSTFIMDDGVIRNNSSVWGGAVSVDKESTFTMNDGEISHNKATVESGGGVYIYVHGTFIMNGGRVSNNEALNNNKRGGGVFAGQGSYASTDPTDWCRVTINGGSIEYNKAYAGGGVCGYWNGQIEMNGGTIANNTANAGGGVCLGYSRDEDDQVRFIMRGGEITGNTATNNYGGGIWVNGSGMQYTVKVEIGDRAGASATHPLIYGNKAATFGGGIYLFSGNTHATIYDGRIFGNSAGISGGGICVAGSSLNIHKGIIGGENSGEANTAVLSGGGIATLSGSNNFVMTGGSVTNNEVQSPESVGGGIYLSSVNYSITGGEISRNTAPDNGGGLYISSSATAANPVSNTIIANNAAGRSGGGAYIESSIEVENVTFSGNAASSGGGIYVSSGGFFTAISGTSFTNNRAAADGGGIYTEDFTGSPGDYSEVQTGDYGNLLTNSDTVFRENAALAAYGPPSNADDVFANIGYASSSILVSGKYINPINNFDINYANEPRITIVSVTYNANGGEGGPYIDAVLAGVKYTVQELEKTGINRKGFKFTGWNTSAEGGGDSFFAGDVLTVTSDTTLYAMWEISNPSEENDEDDIILPPFLPPPINVPKTGDGS